jgi:type VI secretion system secreted protein VgrG
MTQPGPVTIDSPAPLDADTLFFRSMKGTDALSDNFEFTVMVQSSADLNPTDLLGGVTTVHLQTSDGGVRHFNGIIAAIDYLGSDQVINYRIILRPWLWLLTRSSDCRIFQKKSVVDIVTGLFGELGFSDYDASGLTEDYAAREYVVQYRETDFDFVSRLLELEGIYYYFRHDESKHTLVLVDSCTAHDFPPAADGSSGLSLPLRPPDTGRSALAECIDGWHMLSSIQSGAYAHADFDFTKSRALLYARRAHQPGNDYDGFEVYDYPGGFVTSDVGEGVALLRLQERQVPLQAATGWSNARKVSVGSLLSLVDHPRADQNQDYLVTSATYRLTGHAGATGGQSGGDTEAFDCVFAAIPSASQFRAPSRTSKPVVRGPQTATVVGPSGEEIWTDTYGRVKVQFHWDRDGQNDENSSCFVRVSHAWAGAQFGAMHIPRIGQEVIVDFLEGDPDRPIITGRVYNDANMPPYDLPANQTQSGIKSRSTKGGAVANANEIRFEDRMGSEEFFVQAEKDLNSVVKNDETRKVGVDRSVSIGHDETLSVGNDRSVTVGADETIQIANDETVTIGANNTMQVGQNESVTIGVNQTLVVGASRSAQVGATETITVAAAQIVTAGSQAITAGARATTVAAADVLTVGGDRSENIGGGLSVSVGGNRTEAITGDDAISISGGQTISIAKDGALSITKKFIVSADEELVIQSGDASITLKKNGDIVFKGNNISSDASGKVTVKASSDLVLKGSTISQN